MTQFEMRGSSAVLIIDRCDFFPLPVDKPFQDSQKLDCTKNALIGVQAPPHFFFFKGVFFVVVAFFSFFPFFFFFLKLCAKNIG